ncbi:MAG: hypothetical protein GF349_01310 [Candidatus Magasanikbacteria bacterium]|nr:hypothetical protein [Candidatus Magasanikbacteria bacterium]
MNYKRVNKKMKLLAFLSVLALFLCCGSVWQNLSTHQSYNNIDSENGHMSACGSGEMSGESCSSHNEMVSVFTQQYLPQLLILLSAVLLFFVILKIDRFVYYFRQIRDRYGGFLLFNNFIILFKKGILHPRIF